MKSLQPGIIPDLDIDDYHAATDAISKTGLCILSEAPKAYLEYLRGSKRPDTRSLRIGKAFHAILDGTFESKYLIGPDVKSRSEKTWKEFEALYG